MVWGCPSPSFHLFLILSSFPVRALFVLGVVSKGSPPSPGKIKKKLFLLNCLLVVLNVAELSQALAEPYAG